jgi:hypothetical protein
MIGVSALAMTFYPNDSRDRFIQFDAASNLERDCTPSESNSSRIPEKLSWR